MNIHLARIVGLDLRLAVSQMAEHVKPVFEPRVDHLLTHLSDVTVHLGKMSKPHPMAILAQLFDIVPERSCDHGIN